MARFICCNCGCAFEAKDHGTTLTGVFLDSTEDFAGQGQFVFCCECWNEIRDRVKAGAAKCFENGAFVIRCVACGEALTRTDDGPRGTLFKGEHKSPIRRIRGSIRAPFCPKCWARIVLNMAVDMVVQDDS